MHIQYRAPKVDKMKLEPAMFSFFTLFKMADQNNNFIVKESCKSFSANLSVHLWTECKELIRTFRKGFFFLARVKNSSRQADEFPYCFSHL